MIPASHTQSETMGCKKPIFITRNVLMEDLLHKIKLVAKTRATLLIQGVNGSGKEVLAQLFHYYSDHRNKPMVTVNCGAIPSELVESELFGHEKGAFTGAHSQKIGCFEMAHKGTLFLDEIGEMPLAAQVKLLRAVELGSFRRVGGKEEIQVDVSLISATNKVLLDQVKSGCFREDLYYRLNVIELNVPPLRHRREDIPLLIEFYSDYFVTKHGTRGIVFDEDCMSMFMTYDWPGNVRELKNVVERSVILCEGRTVLVDSIPLRMRHSSALDHVEVELNPESYIRIPIGTTLEEIERRVIKQTLLSVADNKTEAAKLLGFARKTLHNKLDKYSLTARVQDLTD